MNVHKIWGLLVKRKNLLNLIGGDVKLLQFGSRLGHCVRTARTVNSDCKLL